MMTAPTAAPGSVAVMRRQGTPHDAAPSSFYVPSPLQQQQNPMGSQQHDSNGGPVKPKKSWGERLKLGKSEKNREDRQQPSPGVSTSPDNNNYLLQEYRNKYGTLSSGSALSKSMKYAETWLYGSVAVRPQPNGSTPRPSLFLYHHPPPPVTVIPATQVVISPGTNYAVVMCSCPEFLTGTARSKKSSSAVCKKCGGSRMLWNVNKGGGTVRATGTVLNSGGTVRGMNSGGTVRGVGGTLRLGGGNSGHNRVRPSLLNLTSTQSPKSAPQQPLKATTPDPYDLMRRNRLGGVNNNENPTQYGLMDTTPQFSGNGTVRMRAKSMSPCRRNARRSPSPPSTVLNHSQPENGRHVSRKDLAWEREYSNWNSAIESPDNNKRKSILECDVTAYELIAKYLKNGNRSATENGDARKMEDYNRSNLVEVSDDDVLDDDMSDDLSDNALENSSVSRRNVPGSRNQIHRISKQNTVSLQSKTDPNSRTQQNSKNLKASIQPTNKGISTEKQSNIAMTRSQGVMLGGQRIRLFNESSNASSPEDGNSYVTDDTEFSNMNGVPEKDKETGNPRQQERASRNTTTSSSLIPRLASPRRPPRKLKSSDISGSCTNNNDYTIHEADENENESPLCGGANSSNVINNNQTEAAECSPPVPSQTKDGRSASTAEGVCVIKSILKKPSTLSPGETSTSLKTFGDTISKPDSSASASSVAAAASGQHSPSPEAAGSGSTDFYLPTFQEFKQQNRKKKQVQFKVANDVTVLQPVEEEPCDRNLECANPVRNSVVSRVVTHESPVVDEKNVLVSNNRQSLVKFDDRNSGDENEHVKCEGRNKDVRFAKQEETQVDFIHEENSISCEVKDEDVPPVCEKEKCKQLVNDDNVKKQECGKESVRFQYFGEGDVTVVNNCSQADNVSGSGGAVQGADKDKGVSAIPSPPAISDAPAVLGGIANTSANSGTDLLRERSSRGGYNLRRSQSERLLPTTSGSLRGGVLAENHEQLRADGVLFNDTMRLRLRPGRPDIRQVFSDPGAPGTYTSNGNGAPIRPQRMLSPGRPRPKEPPPPPPPPSSNAATENVHQSLPELPPRQIFPFTKKQIEQMNHQARQFSVKSKARQRNKASTISKVNKTSLDFETTDPENIRPVSWSPLMDSTSSNTKDTIENLDIVVKKKEHRHSDPGPIAPKLVVHVENSADDKEKDPEMQTGVLSGTRFLHRNDITNLDDRNSLPKMSSKINDNKICTIVTVASAPGSPLADVHRLQIRGEDPIKDVSPISQRRTSILINSEPSPDVVRRHDFFSDGHPSTRSVIVKENAITASPVRNDSSNKVTISVGGDHLMSEIKCRNNDNLSSSCTIIDTSPSSTSNSSRIYNKSNCSSLTVLSSEPSEVNVIPVTQVQRTLLVVDPSDKDDVIHSWNNDPSSQTNIDNSIRILNNTVATLDEDGGLNESVSNVILTPRSRRAEIIAPSPDADDEDALMNPVEAVRRNLIPHVCGKKNVTVEGDGESISSPTERLNKLIELNEEADDNEREKMKEADYCIAAAASKLVDPIENEDNRLYSNVSPTQTPTSKSSEDTLPTVVEHEDEGDDEVFTIEDETDDPSCLQNNLEECRTQDTSISITDLSSECDTAPSSIEPENEGIAENGEDSNTSTSHLPLSLSINDSETPTPEKDDQESEVELREHKDESCDQTRPEAYEENIYESIKDPIYEEIPDTPPPLPLSPPPSLEDLEESKRSSRSIFEGASKYDILSYLVGAKERGIVPEETYYSISSNGDEIVEIIDGKPVQDEEGTSHQRMTSLDLGDLSSRVSHLSNASDSSEDSCNLIISNIGDTPSSPDKVRKSSAEIERNDSGVGSETSKSSRSRWQHCGPASSIREDLQHLCEDCDQPVETQVTDSGVMFAPLVCRKCGKKRAERKEIIAEIVETEEKYGRDLQIIMEEFYRPMLVAGLLTPEQLQAIFLNVEELLEHNAALAEKLRDNLEIAVEQGDEDLLTVNIGKLFLEAAPMLHAFESYCIRQGAASLLLANLEKEKELLRIFLRVSQMENAVLRRMNLNSFLMVPVQRVTKYPLLLARLHKVTPAHHEGRELLRQAQHKIELHLEHMNSEAKDISTTKLWRRISIMNGRRSSSETDILNIKLRKMALDILEWNHDEVRFAMEGKLLYTNPADNNWRKGRTIKLNPINALLVTNGKPTEDYRPDPTEDALMFPRKTGVREATLLLLKEKCGRYTQLREPLYLDKCIVCSEAEWEDYFEVQELASKDTFIFKAEDGDRTKLWYRQLQYHAQGMGAWRRRRNALANIMINGMQTRS